MAGDFEDRLRQSLGARAGDVQPDPALFARVQMRIRRGRMFRLAFAGLATALAFSGVALAAPALVNRRVEFTPAPPVATQPATDLATVGPATETATSLPPAAPQPLNETLVFTDDKGLQLQRAGDASSTTVIGLGDEGGAVGLALRRASSAGAVHAVAELASLDASTCSELGRLQWAEIDATKDQPEELRGAVLDTGDAECVKSPVFSPDGGHLAWIQRSGSKWSLQTMDWSDDGPGSNDASFALPPGVASAKHVDLQDWMWTYEDASTANGYLVLRVQMDNAWQLYRMQIERQGDGALATSMLRLKPVVSEDGTAPLAFAAAMSWVYRMDVELAADGPRAPTLARSVETGTIDRLRLPDRLVGNAEFHPTDLWMAAIENTVMVGNSATGEAWRYRYLETTARPDPSKLVALQLPARDAAFLKLAPTPGPGPSEERSGQSMERLVDIYFGMSGGDACVADQVVTRPVQGTGVARGALTELLKGPTSRESNEGIVSPFNADTAGALNDIAIVGGEARVDFRDFSDDVEQDPCTKSAIVDALDNTLGQFATITSTRYSFDGSTQAWDEWLGSGGQFSAAPMAVLETAQQIRAAAEAHDWKALRRLSAQTSCTLSDQPEPCVPVWKEQEDNGEDPLGVLVELLAEPATQMPTSPMWVWPKEWAAGNSDYSGPRIGIDADGVWRYYVQSGG